MAHNNLNASLHRICTPMRAPFGHARKTRKDAENIVFRLDWEGHVGYGEGVPRDYVTGETPASNYEVIRALDIKAICDSIDVSSFESALKSIESLGLPERLKQGTHPGFAAACAIELALLDSLGRRFGCSLSEVPKLLGLPDELLGGHEVSPTVIALSTGRSIDDLKGFAPNFRIVKIKVGLGEERDLANAKAVRDAFPDLVICADANMAWDLDTALTMVEKMKPYNVSWFEEPMAQGALDDYAAFKERCDMPIMLDESLCGMPDALRFMEKNAVDLFNVRLSKCGGMIPSLRLMELAHNKGLRFQQGMHPGELSILRAAEWKLAEVIGQYTSIEAAFTGAQFDEEISEELLEIDGAPKLVPIVGPGLGINVVPSRLDAATAERSNWSHSSGWVEA